MTDTTVRTTWGENEVSERELRDWMESISKDLKASIAAQALHSQESAVYRASNDARVKNLEDHIERRSALKNGLTLAGLGTLFGVIGSWLSKKMGVGCIAACVLIAGCGATEATRRVNVDNRLAAEFIGEITKDEPVKEAAMLIAAGSTILEAELGTPDVPPLKYDAVGHRKDIEDAKKEIEDKAGLIDTVFNFAQTTAGKITGALGLGALGFTIIGWVRSAAWSGKLWTYAKTAGAVVAKYKDMREEVAEKASSRGVSAEVFKVVEALPVATTPAAVAEPVVIADPKAKPAKG